MFLPIVLSLVLIVFTGLVKLMTIINFWARPVPNLLGTTLYIQDIFHTNMSKEVQNLPYQYFEILHCYVYLHTKKFPFFNFIF